MVVSKDCLVTLPLAAAVVVLCLSPPAADAAQRGHRGSGLTPLIQPDVDAAHQDLLDELGTVAEAPPTLPAAIDPSLAWYSDYFESSGLAGDADQLALYATSVGEGLETLDTPMLRVMAPRALPMLVGRMHALETLEKSRPLTGEEAARLLDDYEILWTFVALYPAPGEVADLEQRLKIDVDPAVHARAAWAEEVSPAVLEAVRYRLGTALAQQQAVTKSEGRLAAEMAGVARTCLRARGDEPSERLYVAAMRYLAAAEPTPKNLADLVLTQVHVYGADGMPKKRTVPAEVRDHESYSRVTEVVAEWREIEELEGDETVEAKLRAAKLLYRRDREGEARTRLLSVAVAEPGHSEALTRLAMTYAEGSPTLAYDILMLADPTAPELQEDSLTCHFPIRWIHVFMSAVGIGGDDEAAAVAAVGRELDEILGLVEVAGTRVPLSRAYSALLADVLRGLWVEFTPMEDMDLSAHLPQLKEVVAANPDEDLYRLVLFAARLSPGFEEYGLLEMPLGEEYDEQTRCDLHVERARSVIAAAVHGLRDEAQLDGIAAEVDAVAQICGEEGITSKLKGDLVVLRTIHASEPPSLDDALPLYEACAGSIDRDLASICRGNLFVIHHEAGREAEKRDAMDRLWRCCTDHAPTLYHAVFAVSDDKLPAADEWLQTTRRAAETQNEPERLYMCAGDIARRTGDAELSQTYWVRACELLAEQCEEGDDPLQEMPGLFLGHGALTLNLTGRFEAPIHVQYEQYLRLLSNCDTAFLEWVQQGGCAAEPGE